jgi:hypothetical protein
MAKYQCVVALNGSPRYFKGQIYDFPAGKELKDKDGNLDRHFVLIEADPEPVAVTDEKPAKKGKKEKDE